MDTLPASPYTREACQRAPEELREARCEDESSAFPSYAGGLRIHESRKPDRLRADAECVLARLNIHAFCVRDGHRHAQSVDYKGHWKRGLLQIEIERPQIAQRWLVEQGVRHRPECAARAEGVSRPRAPELGVGMSARIGARGGSKKCTRCSTLPWPDSICGFQQSWPHVVASLSHVAPDPEGERVSESRRCPDGRAKQIPPRARIRETEAERPPIGIRSCCERRFHRGGGICTDCPRMTPIRDSLVDSSGPVENAFLTEKCAPPTPRKLKPNFFGRSKCILH